ncbi:four helix bundle protein [Fictibacillus halophilus]|uniref:four helix bundle protein n=1 Tax=Fictibacillus halophilus TaxID=1610490 RepID=UPI001CFACBDE|nr:four helix bundle protein [Fictibacillus halophilus]
MKNFRDLKVYQKAKRIAHQLYELSKCFPSYENRELGSQLRRASSSIVLNIGESKQFYVGKEITRLNDAYGSASEVRTILDLLLMRNYITQEKFNNFESEIVEVQKMLYVMINRLKAEAK